MRIFIHFITSTLGIARYGPCTQREYCIGQGWGNKEYMEELWKTNKRTEERAEGEKQRKKFVDGWRKRE